MASIFKPNIVTYQLPDGRHRSPDGKRVTKNTPGAVKSAPRRSKVYYGRYKNANGDVVKVKLFTDKTASKEKLAHLVTYAGKVVSGMIDADLDEMRKRPLVDHLAAYKRHLEAKGNGAEYVQKTVAHCRAVLNGCGFVHSPDLDADAVAEFLHGLRQDPPRPPLPVGQEQFTKSELIAALGEIKPTRLGRVLRRERLEATGQGKARRYPRATIEALQDIFCRGISIETSNHYLTAMKGFTRFLTKGTGKDPLASLGRLNAKTDVRHGRRAMDVQGLKALLEATRLSETVFLGLVGNDRWILYVVAMVTGLRASELASLLPRSFDLTAHGPMVRGRAAYTKNRSEAVQPLPPDVAEALRGYLAGLPANRPVWPGGWQKDAAEMLRGDLAAAGLEYRDDDGLVFDFHALRHSYVTLLEQSGVSPKMAQELARHSDINLTMNIYTHIGLHGENGKASAIESLPRLLTDRRPETLAATGTDGASTGGESESAEMVKARSKAPSELTQVKLPGQDSNLDKESQNLLCYRYTTG